MWERERGVLVRTNERTNKHFLHWNFGTMRARLVVFPIRGRNWCFSRSIDPTVSDSSSAQTPSTFKDLWTKISSSSSSKSDALSIANASNNAEIVTDFISSKVLHVFLPFLLVSFVRYGFRFDWTEFSDVIDVLFVRWIKPGLLLKRLLTDRLKINFTGEFSSLRFY